PGQHTSSGRRRGPEPNVSTYVWDHQYPTCQIDQPIEVTTAEVAGPGGSACQRPSERRRTVQHGVPGSHRHSWSVRSCKWSSSSDSATSSCQCSSSVRVLPVTCSLRSIPADRVTRPVPRRLIFLALRERRPSARPCSETSNPAVEPHPGQPLGVRDHLI